MLSEIKKTAICRNQLQGFILNLHHGIIFPVKTSRKVMCKKVNYIWLSFIANHDNKISHVMYVLDGRTH